MSSFPKIPFPTCLFLGALLMGSVVGEAKAPVLLMDLDSELKQAFNGEGEQGKPEFSRQVRREPIQQVDLEPTQTPRARRSFGVTSDLSLGSSSNVARFEGAPAGTFTDWVPRLFWSPDLHGKIKTDLGLEGNLRVFHDPRIDELFRTSSLTGSGQTTYFFENSFFLGASGKITQFDGRDIDFTSPNNTGRDFRFTNSQANLLLGSDIKKGFVEFSLGTEWLRTQTQVLDEVGNLFFTDFDQIHGGVRVQREITPVFNIKLGYQLKHRQFFDQRARLTNGQVPFNFIQADLLREIEHSFSTGLHWRNFFMELGYDYTEDLVAGGGTRHLLRGSLGAAFNPFSFLLIRPEAGFRNTRYENFIGGLFADSTATEKRNDLFSFLGLDVIFNFGRINPVIKLYRNQMQSNFFILDFEENFISGGIQVGF